MWPLLRYVFFLEDAACLNVSLAHHDMWTQGSIRPTNCFCWSADLYLWDAVFHQGADKARRTWSILFHHAPRPQTFTALHSAIVTFETRPTHEFGARRQSRWDHTGGSRLHEAGAGPCAARRGQDLSEPMCWLCACEGRQNRWRGISPEGRHAPC